MDDPSNEVVYQEYAREMVRFATGLVGQADAPDVVAEAFVRLIASPVWAEAIDRRALWYRAVTFEARSWKRSAVRRRARESVVASSSRAAAAGPEPDSQVLDAMLTLSPQQRAVVMLTYWADLRPAAVGDRLGLSEGTVRKQLARARRKLRGELSRG